ncbi:DUF924 family protein [Psychrobium sp. 1_MG-2023]|uniref:DUF924 family protein n=1 Tax=Psychrobium sp. 1_MG-2023 TaxID=3062624 RepID=UPI000C31ED6F|nr:DUF924 family protein [Psychrobium sp. 1_MG-2023]MDP2561478.1 DUF924 family protein [Psychrobium sp. 1_MG-2023]PKF57744.1 DUF924 domain-containing protein [Alteromonadales bacterium alter-6D02]
MKYNDIIDFWFNQLKPQQHWVKDPKLDQLISQQFKTIHHRAAQCELSEWRRKPEGRLAEIIILDQFSRNMFRDQPQSFAYDAQALTLAQEAINLGMDIKLPISKRCFLYLPFMHSESLAIHKTACQLFNQPGLEQNYEFEMQHYAIIKAFGRYPHRNSILGRRSTPEEISFLRQPNSSF